MSFGYQVGFTIYLWSCWVQQVPADITTVLALLDSTAVALKSNNRASSEIRPGIGLLLGIVPFEMKAYTAFLLAVLTIELWMIMSCTIIR
jgi:hypothetical protein